LIESQLAKEVAPFHFWPFWRFSSERYGTAVFGDQKQIIRGEGSWDKNSLAEMSYNYR